MVFRNCVIERERCQGDGIKTGCGGAFGVKRVLVESCLFQDNGRDGIDTTGGFMDSTVRNTTFRRLLSGLDIVDCVFERTGESDVRMLLMKGGHTVRYENARLCGEGVGEARYTNVFETFGPDTLSQEVSEALNHSVTGTLGPTCEPGAPGDTSVPFDYGPTDQYGSVPADDSGCGCSASPRAAAPWLLVLLLVLCGRRRPAPRTRRRRSARPAVSAHQHFRSSSPWPSNSSTPSSPPRLRC